MPGPNKHKVMGKQKARKRLKLKMQTYGTWGKTEHWQDCNAKSMHEQSPSQRLVQGYQDEKDMRLSPSC